MTTKIPFSSHNNNETIQQMQLNYEGSTSNSSNILKEKEERNVRCGNNSSTEKEDLKLSKRSKVEEEKPNENDDKKDEHQDEDKKILCKMDLFQEESNNTTEINLRTSGEASPRNVIQGLSEENTLFFNTWSNKLGESLHFELYSVKRMDQLLAKAIETEDNLKKQKENLRRRLQLLNKSLSDQ